MFIRTVGRIAAHLDNPTPPQELLTAGRYKDVDDGIASMLKPAGVLTRVDADVIAPNRPMTTPLLREQIGISGRRPAGVEELLIIAARHRDLLGHQHLYALGEELPGEFGRDGWLYVYRSGENRFLRVFWEPAAWNATQRILAIPR